MVHYSNPLDGRVSTEALHPDEHGVAYRALPVFLEIASQGANRPCRIHENISGWGDGENPPVPLYALQESYLQEHDELLPFTEQRHRMDVYQVDTRHALPVPFKDGADVPFKGCAKSSVDAIHRLVANVATLMNFLDFSHFV